MPENEIEIKEFARRVERVCEFFLAKKTGSPLTEQERTDIRVLEDLKEDSADILFDRKQVISETFFGLSDYMKGG